MSYTALVHLKIIGGSGGVACFFQHPVTLPDHFVAIPGSVIKNLRAGDHTRIRAEVTDPPSCDAETSMLHLQCLCSVKTSQAHSSIVDVLRANSGTWKEVGEYSE